MARLRLYLRGGQTVDLNVDAWTLKKSGFTNDLSELIFTTSDATRVPYFRLDSIDAVVEVK
jgi:hypothetical protein